MQFEQEQELTKGKRVELGNPKGVVHSACFGERVRRRCVFRLDKFFHRVAAQECHVGNVLTAVRDGHFTSIFFKGKEGDYLIVRAFRIKLHLRVLVGDAERFYGRLTDVAGLTVKSDVFAEGFRPKLTVPIGKEFQVIRVGHHNADVFALFHRRYLQYSRHQRRVFAHSGFVANAVHVRRARQKTYDVDAEYRRGK